MEYVESLTNFFREKTLETSISFKKIGAENPVAIQTMCNTSTSDVENTVKQIVNVAKKTPCDIIRLTVPSIKDIQPLKEIHKKIRNLGVLLPIVADVHFNAEIAFECAKIVEKVRVNPGNFGHHSLPCLTLEEYEKEGEFLDNRFVNFLNICKEHKTAVRIGTNHGSLSARILNRYGDTPEGMVESVMEFLKICKREQFFDVVISLKSSNPTVAIRAARLMVKSMKDFGLEFPLHLGVTEAGEGEDGRMKSWAGISPLVNDGIGSTIRVSLTEDPENEILPAQEILKYNSYIKQGEKLPEIPFFYDPYHYQKRQTIDFNGSETAVAIIVETLQDLDELITHISLLKGNDKLPDFLIISNSEVRLKAKSLIRDIRILEEKEFEFVDENTDFSQDFGSKILILDVKNKNKTAAMRFVFYKLFERKSLNPVLLAPDNGLENFSTKDYIIASECAGVFVDGFGDGICLKSNSDIVSRIELSFKILQICRLRITGNEYISCPGCGRTLYNLQDTVKKIKEATKSYKNLKIAVMGCIVNGPGEMADADYGYVGDGKNKISLYKNGKIVKKAVDEENAVEELIKLIDSLH